MHRLDYFYSFSRLFNFSLFGADVTFRFRFSLLFSWVLCSISVLTLVVLYMEYPTLVCWYFILGNIVAVIFHHLTITNRLILVEHFDKWLSRTIYFDFRIFWNWFFALTLTFIQQFAPFFTIFEFTDDATAAVNATKALW